MAAPVAVGIQNLGCTDGNNISRVDSNGRARVVRDHPLPYLVPPLHILHATQQAADDDKLPEIIEGVCGTQRAYDYGVHAFVHSVFWAKCYVRFQIGIREAC